MVKNRALVYAIPTLLFWPQPCTFFILYIKKGWGFFPKLTYFCLFGYGIKHLPYMPEQQAVQLRESSQKSVA